VIFLEGRGELPMLEVGTAWSTAEILSPGGACDPFHEENEPPCFFVSQCSRFEQGQPIRGGIPVIFPWVWSTRGTGTAWIRPSQDWELKEFAPASDGSVGLRFRLPDCPEASAFQPFNVDYIVTVSESLKLELAVTNNSKRRNLFSKIVCTRTLKSVISRRLPFQG